MPANGSQKWSSDDDYILLEMRAAGRSWLLIAARLKRSIQAVRSRYYKRDGRHDIKGSRTSSIWRPLMDQSHCICEAALAILIVVRARPNGSDMSSMPLGRSNYPPSANRSTGGAHPALHHDDRRTVPASAAMPSPAALPDSPASPDALQSCERLPKMTAFSASHCTLPAIF